MKNNLFIVASGMQPMILENRWVLYPIGNESQYALLSILS